MIEDQENVGFDKLSLNGGSAHSHNRFAGEDRGSLRNSPDIAGKTEVSQIIQKFFYETAFGPEVFDIRFGEMQILDIIDNLL